MKRKIYGVTARMTWGEYDEWFDRLDLARKARALLLKDPELVFLYRTEIEEVEVDD